MFAKWGIQSPTKALQEKPDIIRALGATGVNSLASRQDRPSKKHERQRK